MKLAHIALILFFCTYVLYCQVQNLEKNQSVKDALSPSGSTITQVVILNILSDSPISSELGKRVAIGNNTSTRALKTSVNLYNFKTLNLSLLIKVDYSVDGFKVNQVRSRIETG